MKADPSVVNRGTQRKARQILDVDVAEFAASRSRPCARNEGDSGSVKSESGFVSRSCAGSVRPVSRRSNPRRSPPRGCRHAGAPTRSIARRAPQGTYDAECANPRAPPPTARDRPLGRSGARETVIIRGSSLCDAASRPAACQRAAARQNAPHAATGFSAAHGAVDPLRSGPAAALHSRRRTARRRLRRHRRVQGVSSHGGIDAKRCGTRVRGTMRTGLGRAAVDEVHARSARAP